MSENWVYLNGKFCLEKQASVPITDRGFLFGDGLFTTIRVHDGKCEFLQNHLDRLQRQAALLELEFEIASLDWISELIYKQNAQKGTWRLKMVVTVKEEAGVRQQGCFLATLHPFLIEPFETCHLAIFPDPFENTLSNIKSLAYLDHLSVRRFAQSKGLDDALTCTKEGFILETGCSNVFWMNEGVCWMPDHGLPYLKGIFLHSILPYLAEVYPVNDVKLTIEEIPATANVYICNSLTHVRPVLSIEQRVFARNVKAESNLQNAIMQALNADS